MLSFSAAALQVYNMIKTKFNFKLCVRLRKMRVVWCCAVFVLCAHVSCLGSTDNDLSSEYDEASLPRDDAIQMLSPSSRADGASAGNGVVSLGGESTPKVAAALGEQEGRRGGRRHRRREWVRPRQYHEREEPSH